MARMVVIWGKTLRYPSGPEGKEYKTGDEFDALSDRDVGHFEKIRAAKRIEDKKKAKPAAKAEPAEPVVTTAQAEPVVEEPEKYKTRVMRPRGIT